jgi:hypothetical protein
MAASNALPANLSLQATMGNDISFKAIPRVSVTNAIFDCSAFSGAVTLSYMIANQDPAVLSVNTAVLTNVAHDATGLTCTITATQLQTIQSKLGGLNGAYSLVVVDGGANTLLAAIGSLNVTQNPSFGN